MRTHWIHGIFILTGLAALCGSQCYAQTDVAASLYGTFTAITPSNNMIQSASKAAGGLLEVRHISKPWIGYEGTYAFNRANQVYSPTDLPCPVGAVSTCLPSQAVVSANAHEVTGDWIASVKVAHFRPFALAGGGILFNAPAGGQSSTTTSTKPVFVYGAGVDWSMSRHFGMRFQYRGNLYKAPNLTTLYASSGALMHTAEPVAGFYFRF